MTPSTGTAYTGALAERMTAAGPELARQWLDRLAQLLPVDAAAIFPTAELLDHIPLLIAQIADYLRAPADQAIAANTSVIEKAQELGHLRHRQQASVHQILREYDILASVLEQFVLDETATLANAESRGAECLLVSQRLGHAIRSLMQTTVDTFVTQYTATIAEQTARLESFNRMLMHELRTPLGTVLFATDFLTRSDTSHDEETQKRLLAVIRRNIDQMIASVRGIERLVFADRTVDTPNQQRVSVAALAGEVARQLADMAAARGVEIRIDQELPELVVDAGQFELVLVNLITNAIKYSDPSKAERHVEVTTSLAPTSDAHTICVRDNGLGIPVAHLGSVFRRSFRGHRERDEELGVDGSGLGLAIVDESVRLMGGRIRVESVEGRGTVFYLTLPVTPPDVSGRQTSDRWT
jgi:signal transduction histidine kinase